ncbi:MAG TPA: SpoIID/LytB domain-containing protein, partial [Acidimicrobiales bacterium]
TDGWVLLADGVAGPVTFTVPGGDDPAAPVANLLATCEPSGSQRSYRGAIAAANGTAGENRTVNIVTLESYLRGVVPRESPALWGDAGGGKGMHALRAQAVAARSYAMAEGRSNNGLRYSYAKTCDTQSCQVYGGAGLRVGGGALQLLEDPRTDQAVADTAGQVLRTGDGLIAYTMFSASNGGRTFGNLFPNVDDPGDATASNPHHTWSVLLTAAQIEAAYPGVGRLSSVTVTGRSGGGAWGGMATGVRMEGSGGVVTVTGDAFRLKFDLKSSWFNPTGVQVAPAGAPAVASQLFIGDSVGTSITTGYQPELPSLVQEAYPGITFDAVSGRCTSGTCSVSPTGVQIVNAIATAPDVAVVELGYNDSASNFAAEVDSMMQALTAKGVRVVLWVNMSTRRTSNGSPVYAPHNAALAAAMGKWKNLVVLDWNAASSDGAADRWFISGDLVHLTSSGQVQFAFFLRQQLDNLRAFGVLTPPPPTQPPTTTTAAPPSPTTSALPVGPYRIGSRGAGVAAVQQFLAAYGYAPGPVDGIYGSRTYYAVRRFQTEARAKGWYASIIDGVWGLRSRDAAYRKQLSAAGVPPPTTTPPAAPPPGASTPTTLPAGPYAIGSRGTGVATVQRFLAQYGYAPGVIDGIYGSQTAGAVKRFQTEARAKGWYTSVVDGVWGTRTRDAALRKVAGG